jgi:hypothetical protein
MARLYSHALTEETVDYSRLVEIFALKGRIGLQSSEAVKDSAERGIKYLVDLYMAPNRSPAEVRALIEDFRSDPMTEFAERCREELQNLR